MENILPLSNIFTTLLISAIIPDPSFVLAARTTITGYRIDGLFAAIGIGGVILPVLCTIQMMVTMHH